MVNPTLPNEIQNVASATCLLPSQVGNVDYIVSTTRGYLLEFYESKIIDSCYTSVKDACDLSFFVKFTIHTNKIFYVIKGLNGTLVVIAKNANNMEVVERHEEVSDYLIADFENCGYSQLYIIKNHSDAPIKILDDSDENFDWQNSPQNLLVNEDVVDLISKDIQALRFDVDSLKNEIIWKESMIRRHLEGFDSPEPEKFSVCVLGSLPVAPDKKRTPILIFEDSWQRVLGDAWILSMLVQNATERSEGMRLRTSKQNKIPF